MAHELREFEPLICNDLDTTHANMFRYQLLHGSASVFSSLPHLRHTQVSLQHTLKFGEIRQKGAPSLIVVDLERNIYILTAFLALEAQI